jgi:hypothetical protein
VDSAGEQEKPEARKMLENGDESHQSAARFVGRTFSLQHFINFFGLTDGYWDITKLLMSVIFIGH